MDFDFSRGVLLFEIVWEGGDGLDFGEASGFGVEIGDRDRVGELVDDVGVFFVW